jgi:lipopolysaccharide export system permease protein
MKRGQMRMGQLIDSIRNVDRDYPMLSTADRLIQKTRLIVEANQRISVAVGCFSFMLIGIPLGVKSHRKETSIGMVLSLAIVFAYYLFIVVAKALANHPAMHPNLILWIPLIAAQVFGLWMIRRSS